jgi:prepilin-type N-terminal cleavage/methylation domain-containing protein
MNQEVYCVVATRRRTKRNKLVNKKKGFTLIELLVVVLIIGILAAIALPQYNKAVFSSRMKEVEVTMKALNTAWMEYQLVHGQLSYPTNPDDLTLTLPEGCTRNPISSWLWSYRCKNFTIGITAPAYTNSPRPITTTLHFTPSVNGISVHFSLFDGINFLCRNNTKDSKPYADYCNRMGYRWN